jgi:hypothetical protein
VALVVATGLTACAPISSGSTPSSSPANGTGSDADGDGADTDPPGSTEWSYTSSLRVTTPEDLAAHVLEPCAKRALPATWVTTENARPGAVGWRPSADRADPRVPLYLDRPSTTCGSPVTAHLGGPPGTRVTVRAYRIGWYAGRGARLVWQSGPVDVRRSAAPPRSGDTLSSPDWATTVVLPVDVAWTPGLYVVETHDGRGVAGLAALVVRDPTTTASFTVVDSNLTWTAYSRYGGSSLYKGTDDRTDSRALRVAIDRPLEGPGVERLLVCDVPVAMFLERHGFRAHYITDTDLDAWPSLLRATPAVVLPGHSEYWTRRMYDALTAARNAGVSIADLGANEIYWHARLGRDVLGDPSTMTVARTLAQDPVAASNPDAATVEWHQTPLLRDPSAVLGQRYSAVRAVGGLQVRDLPGWLSAGTGLRAGDVLPQVVQNEADGVRPALPSTPPDVQTLLVGALRRPGFRTVIVSTTYTTSPSGSAVFAAGTTYWACQLADACPLVRIPAATQHAVELLTLNLLRAFETPRWGATHPSHHGVPPVADVLVGTLPPAAIGTYGS